MASSYQRRNAEIENLKRKLAYARNSALKGWTAYEKQKTATQSIPALQQEIADLQRQSIKRQMRTKWYRALKGENTLLWDKINAQADRIELLEESIARRLPLGARYEPS